MDRSSQPSTVTRQASIWLLLFSCGGSGGGFVPRQELNVVAEGSTVGKVDTPLEIRIRARSGTAPFRWSRMGGVTGMILEDDGGNEATYSGVPDQPGFFSVSVSAEDAELMSGTAFLGFMIAPHLPPPAFARDTLPPAVVSKYYSADLELSGGEPPLTWSIGDVPRGLMIEQAARAIVGRAELPGNHSISISVSDAERRTAEVTLMLYVADTLQVVTETLPPARVGQPYQAEVISSGGAAPYEWTAELPDWLTLEGGVLRGTPVEARSTGFLVELTDGSEQYASRYLTIDVGL